jgi:hypothetical protein
VCFVFCEEQCHSNTQPTAKSLDPLNKVSSDIVGQGRATCARAVWYLIYVDVTLLTSSDRSLVTVPGTTHTNASILYDKCLR